MVCKNLRAFQKDLKPYKKELLWSNNLRLTWLSSKIFHRALSQTLKNAFLPVYFHKLNNQFLIGEVYEYATFLSVEKQDIQEYEYHMSVLKTYYDEFK